MQGYNQRLIEEMKNRQAQERGRLPKIQRSDAKTRMAMFKKSLRITGTGTPEQDREKIKQVIDKEGIERYQFVCKVHRTSACSHTGFRGSLLHRRRRDRRTSDFISTRSMRTKCETFSFSVTPTSESFSSYRSTHTDPFKYMLWRQLKQ